MTQNQIRYWELLENKRHNEVTEQLTERQTASREKLEASQIPVNATQAQLNIARVSESNANTELLGQKYFTEKENTRVAQQQVRTLAAREEADIVAANLNYQKQLMAAKENKDYWFSHWVQPLLSPVTSLAGAALKGA